MDECDRAHTVIVHNQTQMPPPCVPAFLAPEPLPSPHPGRSRYVGISSPPGTSVKRGWGGVLVTEPAALSDDQLCHVGMLRGSQTSRKHRKTCKWTLKENSGRPGRGAIHHRPGVPAASPHWGDWARPSQAAHAPSTPK